MSIIHLLEQAPFSEILNFYNGLHSAKIKVLFLTPPPRQAHNFGDAELV